MFAPLELKNEIEHANIAQIDKVFALNIPANVVDNTDETYVLVTDANTNTDIYGSDSFHGLRRMCEVQIFFKEDLDFDPEAVTIDLYKKLTATGWQIGENRGFLRDIDTEQIYTTFYVTKMKTI